MANDAVVLASIALWTSFTTTVSCVEAVMAELTVIEALVEELIVHVWPAIVHVAVAVSMGRSDGKTILMTLPVVRALAIVNLMV